MNEKALNSPGVKYETGSLPEVFQLIDMIGKKLKQLQRQTISEADLTPSQYFILRLLWQRDGRQFRELATACCCSRSTITGVVDTLAKKELVTRELNPNDRRSLLVRLSEKGRALEHSTPTLEKIFGSCCVGIEPDELRELSKHLKKLDDILTL